MCVGGKDGGDYFVPFPFCTVLECWNSDPSKISSILDDNFCHLIVMHTIEAQLFFPIKGLILCPHSNESSHVVSGKCRSIKYKVLVWK